MFAYCNNHSISRSDKSGLFSCYENDIDGTCGPEYHHKNNNHSPTTHSVVLSYINNPKAVIVKANPRGDKGSAVDCYIRFDEFNGEFSKTEFVEEFCRELTKAVRRKEKELNAANIKIAGSLEYDHILAELRAHYFVYITFSPDGPFAEKHEQAREAHINYDEDRCVVSALMYLLSLPIRDD